MNDSELLLKQIEDLRRQIGIAEAPQLPPRKPYSPADAPELAKFEQFPSTITADAGKPPGNPRAKIQSLQYPRCLYMAQRHPRNGKWVLELERPEQWQYATSNLWERAQEEYQRFSESCLRTVYSEGEHQAAERQGWRNSAAEALEYREQEFIKQGNEAAERNYRDRNMSEAALAESQAVEAEHFGHLPEIPEKPIVRRGRSRKEVPAAPEA